MNIFDGIYNFLTLVNDNWATITAIIVVALVIWDKAKDFFSKSKEEQEEIARTEIEKQIEIAKAQIQEIMLRLVTEAEADYAEIIKSGSIKRSQVIDEIFATYPILSQVATQEEIIAWIDKSIDESLVTLREIIEINTNGAKE